MVNSKTAAFDADALTLTAGRKRPQRRPAQRKDWTAAKVKKFAAVLADSCNVTLAAKAVKRSLSNVYAHRNKDATFRAAWEQALAIGYARLEMMMLERALHGIDKVVTVRGESKIMREYDDRVALALLRQHRDSVAQFEAQSDDDEYREACDRIIDKLARLREREREAEPAESKAGDDRIGLIAIALRAQRLGPGE